MKPNLPSSTFPLGAKSPGTNISKAPESLPRPHGEGFGNVIRSALEKKNIKSDGKSADPSLLAGIGHLTPSPSNRDRKVPTEKPVEGQNAAPSGLVENNGLELGQGPSANILALSSADQNLFQNGIELQSPVAVDVNTIPSRSFSAIPQSGSPQLEGSLWIAPGDPLLGKGSNSPSDQRSDPLSANRSNPVIRDETLSTRMGLETGPTPSGEVNGNTTLSDPLSVTPRPDLLNLKGTPSVDSKESLPEMVFPFPDPSRDLLSLDLLNPPVADKRSDPLNAKGAHSIESREAPPGKDAPSSDRGADSSLPDPLNLLPVEKNSESIETDMEMIKREGIDSFSNGGMKDAVYGPRFQKGSFVEKNVTLAENGLSTPDSGDGLILPENVPPFPTGNGPSFSRIEEELIKTGGTGKIAIEKGSLPPAAQKENSGGHEFFPSPQTLGQSLATSPSHETEKGPLLSYPRTEPTVIYEQVGKQVLWSLKNNEEKIRLVLEPPELGNIYMEVKREKDLIKATLWTDNSATKEILESHQVQLHKLLKADGFALEKFDVFFQQGTGWFQERREKPVGQGPWTQREPKEEGISPGPISPEVAPIQASLFSRGSQYVDVFI